MATINAWNNTVTAASSITLSTTNGAITMNSGTGTISIGTDATAATYNIATGAGAKLVTLGTTNGASSLALKYGTADFTLASATGTIMSALDTGEITFPLQTAFLAFNSATDTDVTGDGTLYTIICDTEIYDQNSDYNNGTGIFTAPITARYLLTAGYYLQGVTALHTVVSPSFVASNRNAAPYYMGGSSATATNDLSVCGSTYMDMDAADTAVIKILCSGSTKTVDVYGAATDLNTFFGGKIVC